jgi:hypothetical protein
MARVLLPTVFRNSLNIAITGLVILGIAIGCWVYFGHHFWTALKGPTQITLADIAKLEDPKQLPSTWVKVKFDKAVKSEVVLEKTRSGVSTIDERYFIFPAGDRWMIACVPDKFSGNELSGQIWRRNAGITREAANEIAKELQHVHQGKLFPFEFDASEDYGQKWKICTGIIGVVAGAGILFSFMGLSGIQRSYKPPRPDEYGLPADYYRDLVIETPEQAEAAINMFCHDAGMQRAAR